MTGLAQVARDLAELRGALARQSLLLEEVLRCLRERGPAQAGEGAFKRVVVFAAYPDFARDYEWLKTAGYITEMPEGLIWNKSKQSLAEYFGTQRKTGKNHRWKEIEQLFGMRGLKNSKSRNGTVFKKPSADFDTLTNALSAAGLRTRPVQNTPISK
ncbi:MAG: hypothetical protein LBR16_05025 [Treponema sp.]|jgi:hypothetical protein|nr:hypothetical protein [Treponema sp.]